MKAPSVRTKRSNRGSKSRDAITETATRLSRVRRVTLLFASASTLLATASFIAGGAERVLTASAGSAPAPAPVHHTVTIPAECSSPAAFVSLAWEGPSCQAHGQMVVRLRNGNRITVAPPDTIAALTSSGLASSGQASPLESLACVNPATHTHVEIYYAHFSGEADNYAAYIGGVQQLFRDVDSNYIDYDSKLYNGPDMHLYVECDAGGNPIVHDIGLSTPKSASNFSTIVSDMQAYGHSSSLAHYWVWTDGNPTVGYAGQSTVIGDDSAGTANAINSSDAYSVNFGYNEAGGGAGIFAHENGHAMGAVQMSAPDTTGAWHCTDGSDVMCYDDGGPLSYAYTNADCSGAPNGTSLLDCHRDDYFNPCPGPGSYLAGHWNIASANDQWLALTRASTSVAFSDPPQAVVVGSPVMLTAAIAGAGCGGGTVTFTAGGTTLATAQLASDDTAAIPLGSLGRGSYSVSASFSGSGVATPSSSAAPATFTVVPAPFTSLAVMDSFGGTFPVAPSELSGHPNSWPGWPIARDMALTADGRGGYVLDGWGGIHAFGDASQVTGEAYWPGWDIARGIALRANGTSGYVLDGWGGVHPFGGAPDVSTTGYWYGWDIASHIVLRSDGTSGYVLDDWGGLHPFGGAPALAISGYWYGWSIAKSFTLDPDGAGGYVLDGLGGLHEFGNAPPVVITAYWPHWDIAREVVSVPGAAGDGWVIDGWGGLHPFGDAPAVAGTGYWPGQDLARAAAVTGP